MVDKLPKKVYKPGEKIPMTEDMVSFLCQLWARDKDLELKSVTYEDSQGKKHQILYP